MLLFMGCVLLSCFVCRDKHCKLDYELCSVVVFFCRDKHCKIAMTFCLWIVFMVFLLRHVFELCDAVQFVYRLYSRLSI
jgi:hypothetical protein